jgi:hypothetical protein
MARTAAEKPAIDTPRLMQFGYDYMQPSKRCDAGPKGNVGAATRDIGRNRNLPQLSRAGDDLRFGVVLSSIEQSMLQTGLGERGAGLDGGGDGSCRDENGLPSRMPTSGSSAIAAHFCAAGRIAVRNRTRRRRRSVGKQATLSR